MKILLRFLVVTLIFTLGTAVLAEGLQMDRVSVTYKSIEDEEDQKWLYFTSYAQEDWLSMRLFGKFYFTQLDDKYEDTSRDGLGDLYSGVRAHFRFPEFSKGFKSTLGYKWNEDFQIYMYGLGYDWRIQKNLTMGLWYEGAERDATTRNYEKDNYDREKQEFLLNYNPGKWGYSLVLTRSDYYYPDADDRYYLDSILGLYRNNDYSVLSYTLNQKLNWKATSKLNVGLGYRMWNSEYYNDPPGDTYHHGGTDYPKGKIDTDGKKASFEATYVQNKRWTWKTEITQSNSEGYTGTSDIQFLGIDGKYTSNSNWTLTSKIRFADLEYSDKYTREYENPLDKDADYTTRKQQTFALDFKQKLPKFTYSIEPFIKNYDYAANTNKEDNTKAEIIATLEWKWNNLNWYFLAAPEGTLTTRKGLYILSAQYKF